MNLKIEIKVENFKEQKENINQTFIRVDSEKPMINGKEYPIDRVGKIFMDKKTTIKYLLEFLNQNLP